jgi:hypothetical protein
MPTTATHVWRPSSARRVLLDAFIPVARGATAVAPPLLAWPTKDPGDVLDYQLDISPALVGNDGDSIATLDVQVTPAQPGDLMLTASAADGTSAILWFAAGQPNTVYSVSVSIGTVNGRSIHRSVVLPVLALSTASAPATALQTDVGFPITDQNGNPVLTA